jgi:hypothetical protein
MPKKKKKKEERFSNLNIFGVYGIWSCKKRKLVFISLTVEEAELKYDIEDYNEEEFRLVEFDIMIDVNSLEQE